MTNTNIEVLDLIIQEAKERIHNLANKNKKVAKPKKVAVKVEEKKEAPAEKCPSCGAIIAPNAKFCAECGTKILRNCPECGTAVTLNQKFCPECGKALYKKEN